MSAGALMGRGRAPGDPALGGAKVWAVVRDSGENGFGGNFDDDDADYEEFSLKEAFELPDELPPMRLPAEAELAAMSRAAPLLGEVRRLAEWAGTGRQVNWDGELTTADTVAAARELGIEVPAGGDVSSLRSVPELARLWQIAIGAGFTDLDIDGAQAGPGEALEAWPGGTDEEVLDVWCAALACVLDHLEVEAALDAARSGGLDFRGAGVGLVLMLFLMRGDGVGVREASDAIQQDATAELPMDDATQTWATWTQAHGDPGTALLSWLARLGAVSLTGEPASAPAEAEDGPVARLTPLGMWAMREQLTEEAVEIPLLPPAAEMTAADLITATLDVPEPDAAAETRAWLELRPPDRAATELLAVAADGGPGERMLAVAAVTELGAAAEPAWREVLTRPVLRPYAKIALTELAGGSPDRPVPGLEPEPGDLAWLLIDLLAVIPPDDPEELVSQLADSVPAGREREAFEAMARSAHPDAGKVLTLIGKMHPDKRIAKAARTSAYQAPGGFRE